MKKIYILLATMFALSSCIQITNENKAINGSNDEGGNSYTRENYEYSSNEYSGSGSSVSRSSGSSNSMSCYSGSIGGSSATMYLNTSITSGKVGYYYYNKYKKHIDLYVSEYGYDGDGTVQYELSEHTPGHGQTGVFQIAIYPSHTIRGSFINSNGRYFDVNMN